jgi:3-methyladenine DNA glycosylase/8-oxoguanine DNA glycosylase
MKPKFNFDPVEAVAHLRASDAVLGALIDRVGPLALELKSAHSLFEAMLRSIVYQQLHAKAASTILGRVLVELDRHGGAKPEALACVSDAALRGAGLSANKLLAVRDLAAKCIEGTSLRSASYGGHGGALAYVPTLKEARKLGDDELVTRLTTVRGIGPWTVHMLLIFYLGRPDVMPTSDFAIRAGFKKLYKKRKDPTPEAILKHARRWQPYRSVASWYLWRSLD